MEPLGNKRVFARARVSSGLSGPLAGSELKGPSSLLPHVVQRDKGQTLSIIRLSGSTPSAECLSETCRLLTANQAQEDTCHVCLKRIFLIAAHSVLSAVIR